MKKDIKILAIETSCDETSAAVISDTDEISNSQFSISNQFNNETMKQWRGKRYTRRPVILSNIVSSQVDLHKKTGGVVPEVASRAHMEAMIPAIEQALLQANPKFEIRNPKQILNSKIQNSNETIEQLNNVTHIAVTAGPGLIGSLLVGFNTAKAMAYALDVPIVPINHIEGHIYSALAQNRNQKSKIKNQNYNSKLQNFKNKESDNNIAIQPFSNQPEFPILALTVSGGHTSLTLMRDHGVYETIGQTRDDAAGEAFDKVAKLLNLGYPGGPIVSKLAYEFRNKISNFQFPISNEISNSKNIKLKKANKLIPNSYNLVLPRPMIKDKNFDFSFSGLKTAVLEEVKNLRTKELKNRTAEICAAFEDAAVDVLVTKTLRAVSKYQPKSVILAGGVAANKRLREELADRLLQITNHPSTMLGAGKSQITNNYQYSNLKSGKADKLTPNSYNLLLPPAELCGDNAAMIGLAAYYHILRGDIKNWNQIKIDSNLKI